jgi:hypothetical protein
MAVSAVPLTGSVQMGSNGRRLQWGTKAFVTTAATASITVQGFQVIEAVLCTAAGATTTNETFCWTDTRGSDGKLHLTVTDNTIEITRIIEAAGAGTSGLEFSFLIIGY